MNQYATLASDSVIWENIGGQVLTANLSTGVYCNLGVGTACVIWHLLISGLSMNELASHMKKHYDSIPESFLKDVDVFVKKLINANILKFSNKSIVPDSSISRTIKEYDSETQYKNPTILLYDDINTLLQIDPIEDEIAEILHDDAR